MAPPQDDGGATSGKGDRRREKSLRLSIKNRSKGLCKKAYELATLCDVKLALVCYPSNATEPITWPPDRSKIENAIHDYLDTPAHKKAPKNQITLDSGADKRKDAGKAVARVKAEEEADRLRVPFHDDEDKLMALGRILESRLEAVRKMIAVRRAEERRDPRPSVPYQAKKVAVAAGSAAGGDPATSNRDRGKRVAGDFAPVWEPGHPGFAAPALAPSMVAAVGGDGGAPNSWFPCMCLAPAPAVGGDGGAPNSWFPCMCLAPAPAVGGDGGAPNSWFPCMCLAPVPAVGGDGGAPNSWFPCFCFYCPDHGPWFTGW